MFDHFLCHHVLLHHHLNPVPVPKHDDGVGEHEQVAANHQPRIREDRLRAEQGLLLVNFPSRWSLSLSFALCVDPQHHSNRETGTAMY